MDVAFIDRGNTEEGEGGAGAGRRASSREGCSLAIAPEGTRSPTPRLGALQEGRVPHRDAGGRADRADRDPQRRRAAVARLAVHAPRHGRRRRCCRRSTRAAGRATTSTTRSRRSAGTSSTRSRSGRPTASLRRRPMRQVRRARRGIVGHDGRVARRRARAHGAVGAARRDRRGDQRASTPTRATCRRLAAAARRCARPRRLEEAVRDADVARGGRARRTACAPCSPRWRRTCARGSRSSA